MSGGCLYRGATGTKYLLLDRDVLVVYTWGTSVTLTFANTRLAWTYATQHGKREVQR